MVFEVVVCGMKRAMDRAAVSLETAERQLQVPTQGLKECGRPSGNCWPNATRINNKTTVR